MLSNSYRKKSRNIYGTYLRLNFDFRYDFHDFLSVLNCTPALVIVGEADGEEAFHRHGQHHVDRAHQRYLQGGCE